MAKRTTAAHLAAISLDPSATAPLYRQLYFAIREAILAGRLQPGTRLPSTRTLASDLGLSRNTAVAAYEQLLAEGYLDGRVGAGSYVSNVLPEALLHARRSPTQSSTECTTKPKLSRRGAMLANLRSSPGLPARAFSLGLPELAGFPFEDWARLLARRWRRPPRDFLVGVDPSGYRPLREALAHYLGASRAVSCDPDQILIVSGAQQALDLVARALIDPGDSVWVEEPGFSGTWSALLAAGAALTPVPIDDEGIDIEKGRGLAPDARLICVSPSHQYPLGITMSLRRRLELLDWADAADAFVLEDDYDSEYRYAGRPLAAMQGLDEKGRIIYVGSFSKVMFPGLRIGYMVAPKSLIEPFRAIRRLVDSHPSSIAQAALADFISDGYLTSHIRRMRSLYAGRQQILLEAAATALGDEIQLAPDHAGMHLVGYLPKEADDAALSRRAGTHDVVVPPLSAFYRGTPKRKGLLFGYAGVPDKEIRRATTRLAEAFAKD
jgi:GntR family transcriptional regulator/MocR family aminotransferase